MTTRLLHLWDRLTSSYWFVPALMLFGAAMLSVAMLFIDERLPDVPAVQGWVYGGGAEGARTLLSAVASSVVTVAGVVFSITIAALTQASSQFGPRLLRNFMRDTGNQIVLGTFVATFLYCILILRRIRGGDAEVPHLSVTVAVVLAVASLCVLVYFIHHVSFSMQAPQVVARVWDELQRVLERMYPEGTGEKGLSTPGDSRDPVPSDPFGPDSSPVGSGHSGYIQAVDSAALMRVAVERDLRLKVLKRPGSFVVRGSPLVLVWPAEANDDGLSRRIKASFIVGRHRTPEQDVEFAINQMVEIAVRALSPGINDPFTAMNCIDWLGEALCRIAARDGHSMHRCDETGRIRILTSVSSFRGMVDASFDQIRQYGRSSVAVTIRLLETLAVVARQVESQQQREPLLRQAEMIFRQSRITIEVEEDRRDVEDRYQDAITALFSTT